MTNDELMAQSESWRKQCLVWQQWAESLLWDMSMHPPGGLHGDRSARDIIARLAKAGAISLDRKAL
jgi:hypothetical protein